MRPGPASSKRTAPPRTRLAFEPNVGQTDRRVAYVAHGPGFTLYLTRRAEAVVAAWQVKRTRNGPRISETTFRTQFVGATAPKNSLSERLSGRVNYLIGRDRSKWQRAVPTFGSVRQHGIYPGIDLAYYSRNGQPEYDFRLAPGAKPTQIAMRFPGATGVQITPAGDLRVSNGSRSLSQLRPIAYQPGPSGRKPVAARYLLDADRVVRVAVGHYDRTRPLIIDPVMIYSTTFGGSHSEEAEGIDVGTDGSTYLVGTTYSTGNFPLANAQDTTNTYEDAFVTKLAPDGHTIAYSTYYGGDTSWDYATSGKADSSGSVFVGGQTDSTDLPTVNAFQDSLPSDPSGAKDDMGFVARLTPDGSGLVYSTYFGGVTAGSGETAVYALAIDGAGSAYVTGATRASDFPTKDAAQSSYGGGNDAFVAKFSASGGLIYATYLGGSGDDSGERAGVSWDYGIAVDSSGAAYVTGATDSTDFPTTDGAFQTHRTSSTGGVTTAQDGFITKLAPDGKSKRYSTYLGGSREDLPFGIAVDSSGSAYVVGRTHSSDFPSKAPFQTAVANGFVTKLKPDGSDLVYSTYLGAGTGYGWLYAVAVDRDGRAHVGGEDAANGYPLVNPIYSTGGGMIAVFARDGQSLLFSSFLPGVVRAIAVGQDSDIYVGGYVRPGIGDDDAYAGKISPPTPTIVGTATEGQALTASTYGWPTAAGAPSYTYQWERCDQDGASCADVLGATNVTYVLSFADVASTLRVRVTAAVVGAPQTAESIPTEIVGPNPAAAASRFRPWILFDFAEPWRPLNINTFLSERYPGDPSRPLQAVCDNVGCEPSTDQTVLARHPSGWILPGTYTGAYNSTDFRSPNLNCVIGTLLECDAGPTAAIYYQTEPSSNGWFYIDYWVFYRYNDFTHDHHEGDWEGVTAMGNVALQSLWAVDFAQHNSRDWEPFFQIHCGATAYCGAPGAGTRPWVYVAHGSHASYPNSCSSGCTQPGPPIPVLPEGTHDGSAPWGANDDDTALSPFPTVNTGNWVDWHGRWGASCAPLFDCAPANLPDAVARCVEGLLGSPCEFGVSPPSPGTQGRFTCPSQGQLWDTSGTACTSVHNRARRIHRHLPNHCRDWFGSTTVVLACSPRQLRAFFRGQPTLGPGAFSLRVSGHRHAGSSPGLASVTGPPLRRGSFAVLRGRVPTDINIFAWARDGRMALEAHFVGPALAGASHARLEVPRSSRTPLTLQVRLRDGRVVHPVWTRRFKVLPKTSASTG